MGFVLLVSTLVAASATAAISENPNVDIVTLVQKSVVVGGEAQNLTSKAQIRAAEGLLVKLSGLIHMIDHELANDGEDDDVLEKLFECTRGAGLPTADKILGLTNGIVSLRGNCVAQNDANGRRACAKDVVGFLADTLGLMMMLPQLPETCFMQDCSAKGNFPQKMAPVVAAAGGLESLLGLMGKIGNIDDTCISMNTANIAGDADKNLMYPAWLYWVLKPFDLLSSAFNLGVLAADKEAKRYHYGICGDIAGFTGSALGLMEALFDAKAHEEQNKLGNSGQSAQWACAGSVTGLISVLPGVISIACGYESCKAGEQIADALKSNWNMD